MLASFFALPFGPRLLQHVLVRPATAFTELRDLFTASESHHGLEGR
jgi:hypothetical protein